MNTDKRTPLLLLSSLLALLAVGPLLPEWQFLATLALGKGLVVLGLLLLLRTGLVSFGQGLYYCLGGYAAGVMGHYWGVTDATLLLLAAALVSGCCWRATGPSSSPC